VAGSAVSVVRARDADLAGVRVAGVASPCAVALVALAELGSLTPTGRPGGQGRVYLPQHAPPGLGPAPVVVKLYRRAPPAAAVDVLGDMIAWSHRLPEAERMRLHGLTAWPLAIVGGLEGVATGIVMRDLTGRFAVPFTMPSGRRQDVLLSLEHLLSDDGYLPARGLGFVPDTVIRLRVAERISRALAFLHDRAIVVSDIAPNNLLISFGRLGPPVSFIDCDSMVFRGRQALATVQTTDWQLPRELDEAPGTRAADAYKLGLIVLRLLARSHDARAIAPHRRHVPAELRELLARALGPEPALRPAAGEWQRALELAGGRPQLGSLYPGPLVRARRATATAPPPAAVTPAWPGSRAGAPAPAGRPPGRGVATGGHRPARNGLTPLALVWVAIGAVLLTLVLARMFAAAIPVSQTPQFGNGGGAPASGFYVVPDRGGGLDRGNQGLP
jgi:hypothetical protein